MSIVMPCFAMHNAELRGKRFCEVIISKGKVFEIYNTIHLNDCPDATWSQINIDSIKQETGANYVILNGPRRLIIDGIKNAEGIESTPKSFHGLAMHKSGVLILSFRETLYGSQPFREHHVTRRTTWVYAPGKKIYELIDKQGHVYIMQSFALNSKIHNEDDLAMIEKHLRLPRGWVFKTGILSSSNDLEAIGQKAVVIQDNMKNTYQLASHDWLN